MDERERELQRRIEAGKAEIVTRLSAAEKRWEEGESERRREWEALEGRFMTAEEKRQVFDDALFRKMNAMSGEYLHVLHEINDGLQSVTLEIRELRGEMRHEFTESRAEARAGREALLRMLDRVPPPKDPPRGPS